MPRLPSVPDLIIRPIAADDRARWTPLWVGYNTFYDRTIAANVSDQTWKRLTETEEIEGMLALTPTGETMGLVHFFYHPSTSLLGGACYLADLFVVPEARGLRVGRRLIAAVTQAAKAKGASILYWQTEEFNGTARRLYERVAKRAPFIRYNIEL